MKTALIHDWFYTNGGAERVVKSLNGILQDADLFALIDFLSSEDRKLILNDKKVNVSFIQKLPGAKKNHRKYLQFFPAAIERFDLSNYDVIISSSSSVAKGVLTNQNQLHICYCHSPARYAWDLYFQYLNEEGLGRGLKGLYARYVLRKFRSWDFITHQRVDFFISNSKYIAKRIKKVYGRESEVIYPPVDTNFFVPGNNGREEFYFTASRLVSYKRIELIVEAFNKMPDKRLFVSGDGPEFNAIRSIANKNITLLGFVENEQMLYYLQRARAFIFMAEEDFGIIPVEAQSCGTPVIGYGKGGLVETVIDGKTGILFKEQSIKSLLNALEKFQSITFDSDLIRNHALQFSEERFHKEFKNFLERKVVQFKSN